MCTSETDLIIDCKRETISDGFTRPLPSSAAIGIQPPSYVSCFLLVAPSSNAVGHHVIFLLTRYVLLPSSPPPAIIDSNQSTNFTSQTVQSWAIEHRILCNFYLVYLSQAVGFIERHNGLLKDTFLKLWSSRWSPKWAEVLPQAVELLNSLVLSSPTPTHQLVVFSKDSPINPDCEPPLLWH